MEEEIEKIKKDIEEKLSRLVHHVSKEYASPAKKELLQTIDKKLKFYLENCEDKTLQTLLLLNEFIAGIMVGFR